jgi:hypothetical protein
MHQADIKIHNGDEDVTGTHMPTLTKLSAMGGGVHIPPRVLYPLHQLGITDHTQLVCQKGTHIISCQDLHNLHGTAVRDCHKRALNRVSLLISCCMPAGYTGNPAKYPKLIDLPSQCRELPTPLGPKGPTTAGHTKDI